MAASNRVSRSASSTTTVTITTTRAVDDVTDEQIFALGDLALAFDDVTFDGIMAECEASAPAEDCLTQQCDDASDVSSAKSSKKMTSRRRLESNGRRLNRVSGE